MGAFADCGCPSREDDKQGIRWEELERILREIEEADNDPEAIPVEDDDVFSPVRKREEVEVER